MLLYLLGAIVFVLCSFSHSSVLPFHGHLKWLTLGVDYTFVV